MRPSAMARGNSTPDARAEDVQAAREECLVGRGEGSGLGEAYAISWKTWECAREERGLGQSEREREAGEPCREAQVVVGASFCWLYMRAWLVHIADWGFFLVDRVVPHAAYFEFDHPLTPARHAAVPPAAPQVNVRKVDITAAGLRAVLDALVSASAPSASLLSRRTIALTILDADDSAADARAEIFVKVLPPVYLRAVITPAFFSAAQPRRTSMARRARRRTCARHLPKSANERVEAFMSAWTRLVGDPILSKWITILLAISITLNGYLLKGIAAGVVGIRLGPFAGGARGGEVRGRA